MEEIEDDMLEDMMEAVTMYSCKRCSYMTKTPADLRKHIQQNHNQKLTTKVTTGAHGAVGLVDYISENKQLINDIKQYCERSDFTPRQNILLMGKCGAGKSALVNTITKALVGDTFDYQQRAKVGGGETSKTLDFSWYEQCGIEPEDLQRGHPLNTCFKKLPTIMDSAGVSEENIESFDEILRLVIKGYIPPNKSIVELEEIQQTHGIGKLSRLYKRLHPEWRVSKVVYVQSGRDTEPKKLIERLQVILRSKDMDHCSLFIIVTRLDLVDDGSSHYAVDTHGIPTAEFDKVVETVAKDFNVKGALGNNLIRWKSYNDETGFQSVGEIDNIALQFVKEMVKPTARGRDSHEIPTACKVMFWTQVILEKAWRVGKMNVMELMEQIPDQNFRDWGVDPTTGRNGLACLGVVFVVFLFCFLSKALFL